MSAGEFHKDDNGIKFDFTIKDQDSAVVDISGATTKEYIFTKPIGSDVTKTPSFITDGTDGQLRYSSVSGDLDEIGIWKIQAHIVTASWDLKSDIIEFRVYSNL